MRKREQKDTPSTSSGRKALLDAKRNTKYRSGATEPANPDGKAPYTADPTPTTPEGPDSFPDGDGARLPETEAEGAAEDRGLDRTIPRWTAARARRSLSI